MWNIQPFSGVGQLEFGMSRSEVDKILGPLHGLTGTLVEEPNSVREVRGSSLPICTFLDERLYLVDTHAGIEQVVIFGINPYSMEPELLLRHLEAKSGGAVHELGFIVFPGIGVNTSGFFNLRSRRFFSSESDQDDRGIAAFARGAFDDVLGSAEKLSFLG